MLSLEEIRRSIAIRRREALPISTGQFGATIGMLTKICNGDRGRHLVMMWLFPDLFPTLSSVHAKLLGPGEKFALSCFVGASKIDGKIVCRYGLIEECTAIVMEQSKILGLENVDDTRTTHHGVE